MNASAAVDGAAAADELAREGAQEGPPQLEPPRGARDGGAADDRPVHFQEIFATLYNNLSIDTDTTTITDLQGRPHYIVDKGYKPLPEVA